MRRLTVPIALVLLASSLVLSMPSSSFASSAGKVTVKLSNASPGTSTPIQIKVCWSGAPSGDTVILDEESTASLLWAVVASAKIPSTSGCRVWHRSSGKIGNYPYRAEVRLGHSVLDTSATETERTFGTISAMTFFTSVIGCQGGGSVTSGGQSYSYFCTLSAAPESSSNANSFLHRTSCRSLTLRMTATDNPAGSASDASNDVVEVQQSGLVQPAIFGSNEIENFTYHLNGTVSVLNVWASPGFSTGESVYFLDTGSTAVCSTATGI
jgi:hypothetical protein